MFPTAASKWCGCKVRRHTPPSILPLGFRLWTSQVSPPAGLEGGLLQQRHIFTSRSTSALSVLEVIMVNALYKLLIYLISTVISSTEMFAFYWICPIVSKITRKVTSVLIKDWCWWVFVMSAYHVRQDCEASCCWLLAEILNACSTVELSTLWMRTGRHLLHYLNLCLLVS